MTATEQNILEALQGLELAVKRMASSSSKPDLLAIFSQIDQLTADLPRNTDPRLLHYLHKKSYEKARSFLLGEDRVPLADNPRHV